MGSKHTDEAKAKMSAQRKGKPHSAEHNRNVSEALKGRKHNYKTPGFSGRHHTEESRMKTSESVVRHWAENPDSHYWHTPEGRAEVSNRMMAIYADDELREGFLVPLRKTLSSPEYAAKCSELMAERILSGKFKPNSNYKTGYYHSTKMDADFHYRSSYELRAYQILDADPFVTFFFPEPIAIPYTAEDGQVHHYVPDLYVEYKSGYWQFLEIKPEARLKEADNELKHQAAMGQYTGHFQVWTEDNLEQVS